NGRLEFKDAKLKSMNLSGSTFHGPVSFANSDLRYANLQNIKFENSVDWTNAQLSGATWLDGRTCGEGSVGTCL
ncbi:MAG: pentapeptide repeat-containing protein, partial [Proteobacteria bacterium]